MELKISGNYPMLPRIAQLSQLQALLPILEISSPYLLDGFQYISLMIRRLASFKTVQKVA